MIEFDCPECGEPVDFPDTFSGGVGRCPYCRNSIQVPVADSGYSLSEDSLGTMEQTAGLDQRKGRSSAPVLAAVSGAVALAVLWLGGFALHIWTVYLFWDRWGLLLGVVALCAPVLSAAVAVFACFWWHIWYYMLAVAIWLVSLVGFGFVEDNGRLRPMWFVGWICVLAILSVSFVHCAWRYSLGPTSLTPRDQAELEDCAAAVLACLVASASHDPSVLASLPVAKKDVKTMVRDYSKGHLDELCSMVDDALRCARSVYNDLVQFVEGQSRSGATAKFKISDTTREMRDKLPRKLRKYFRDAETTAAAQQLGNDLAPFENWREVMSETLAETWTIYGESYTELLGRPMPPLGD